MAAVSLAIIGKDNRPLYLREFVEDDAADDNTKFASMLDESALFGMSIPSDTTMFQCSARQEFILHAALDRFEQLAGPPPEVGWRQKPGSDGMFVGLLCPVVDGLRVYGYCTTTKVKFFIVVEDEALSKEQQVNADSDIKSLLQTIHRSYVEEMLNPFKDISAPINSRRFDEQITNHIAAFNQSDGMI
jgi:hypothetical protein